MTEEPISEDLEEAVNAYIGHAPDIDEGLLVSCKRKAFKAGAEWQKKYLIDKVCVKLKKLMYDNLMFQGRLHREEVIDNFVEDFKKTI